MAESETGDKSEKASAQKLRKAREQGQVPRSKDWSTAVGILVSLKAFVLLLPWYLEDFRVVFGMAFVPLDGDGGQDNAWSNFFLTTLVLIVKMIAPLLLIPLVVMAVSLFPGGWTLSMENLMPKLSRMSPAANLGRLVSGKHYTDLAVSIAKVALMIVVLVHVARSAASSYVALQGQTLDQAMVHGAGLMMDGVMALITVIVVFGMIDMPVQIFFFMKQQRMSKQDMKEEHKSAEGRPEVKNRIRQIQQQIARRSVRKTVPNADVVIVNPEHYAVALKYDESRAEAPFVIAKGVDEMALFIKQVAKDAGVEIVTIPPLARAIYNTSQVQQQIPAALYKAVAQVLGYVLQLKAFQTGRRQAPPVLPSDLPIPIPDPVLKVQP
jgi:flagellar biosynthetic protein FlhB